MLATGAVTAAVLALSAAPGTAATDGPSPSPTAVVSSPGLTTPLDSNGTPVVTPEQKIDPYVRSSIVYMTIKWKAWPVDKTDGTFVFTDDSTGGGLFIDEDFTCTGYVVNPNGYIATAGHCVSPLGDQKPGGSIHDQMLNDVANLTVNNGYFVGHPSLADVRDYWKKHLRLEGSDKLGAVGKPDRIVTVYWGANVSGIEATKGRTARVLGFQEFEAGDGALLKVNEADMNSLLLVPGDTTVDTGTSIAAVGYAGSVRAVTDADFHPDVKTGTISSQKTRNDIPVYELDAAVSPGMSGGPTVNDQGQVIGTNSFGINGEPQSFNFVGTSQRVLELLNSQGVNNELSQDSQDMRNGLDAYFAGDKATAVAKLTSVKEAQPSNDIVTDYLARAKALPNPAPPEESSSGVPAWAWALVVLVLLVLAAAGVILLLRRRPRSAHAGGEQAAPGYPGAYPGGQSAVPLSQLPQSEYPAAPVAPSEAAPTQPLAVQPIAPEATHVPSVGIVEPEPATAPAAPVAVAEHPVTTTAPAGFSPSAEVSSSPVPAPVATPVAEPVAQACTSCGTRNPAGQRFCGNCGSQMGT
jgi:V8-like Glu-specific endopeptidase